MADCPGCGGMLRYDIPSEKVICDYCKTSYDPESLDTTQMAEETEQMGVREFHCPNCGGDIFSTDKDVTGVCSYCGSKVVFESRLVSKKRPQIIIPFKKTREECRQLYADFLKGKLFVPKEIKDPKYIDAFRGIYMPYWISDLKQEGLIRYYTKNEEDRGKLVFKDTYRVVGNLEAEYDHFYHDGGSGFSDDLSEKLEPYQLYDSEKNLTAKTFYPAYLSGFYAEPADLDFEQYGEYFEDLADRQTMDYLSKAKKARGTISTDYKSYAKMDLLEPLDPEEEKRAAQAIAGQTYSDDINFDTFKARGKLEKLRESQLNKAYEKCPKVTKELTQKEALGYQTEQTPSMALFPVWFMAWKKKNRVAYLTINGQTGKVCADLPIDYFAFFKIFLLITALCFAAVSYFTVSVYMMPVLAAWLSAVILHMEMKELDIILERSAPFLIHKKRKSGWGSAEIGMVGLAVIVGFPFLSLAFDYCSDGFSNATGYFWRVLYVCVSLIYGIVVLICCLSSWGKLPKGSRIFPVFLLNIAAAIFSFLVVINDIPSDAILYGSSGMAFIAIMITLLCMIRQYNIAATRPLPQFEHRGGDDHA